MKIMRRNKHLSQEDWFKVRDFKLTYCTKISDKKGKKYWKTSKHRTIAYKQAKRYTCSRKIFIHEYLRENLKSICWIPLGAIQRSVIPIRNSWRQIKLRIGSSLYNDTDCVTKFLKLEILDLTYQSSFLCKHITLHLWSESLHNRFRCWSTVWRNSVLLQLSWRIF